MRGYILKVPDCYNPNWELNGVEAGPWEMERSRVSTWYPEYCLDVGHVGYMGCCHGGTVGMTRMGRILWKANLLGANRMKSDGEKVLMVGADARELLLSVSPFYRGPSHYPKVLQHPSWCIGSHPMFRCWSVECWNWRCAG